MVPDVRYAEATDGTKLAYVAVGEGEPVFIVVPGLISQLEVAWEEPAFVAFVNRFAANSRVVVYDRRGTGLSDRGHHPGPDPACLRDDIAAVLRAVAVRAATLVGLSLGVTTALAFAAAERSRTDALILFGGMARWLSAPDHPIGMDPRAVDEVVERAVATWGTGALVAADAPDLADDPRFRRWAGRLERHTCPPGTVRDAFYLAAECDVRSLLPDIRVPTLVLHRSRDAVVDVQHGRHLAAAIPGSRFVELAGDEHLAFVGDQAALFEAIAEFLDECLGGPYRGALASRRSTVGEADLGPGVRQVVDLVAMGLTNAAIARRLRISPHTVDGRLRRAFAKYRVNSRAELAAQHARDRTASGDAEA
jgi:pimeloyl-ACP methyl ester carboxylesterase